MNNTIQHLEEIKKIKELKQQVFRETNIPIYDVSNWNSGQEYKHLINQTYIRNCQFDYLDYHYSYEYDDTIKKRVIYQLLEISTSIYNCVFIHSATAAICCIADYLKKHGFNKICVLEPAYFSICACLRSFGLNVQTESIILDFDGNCIFPYDIVTKKQYDAIWVTSPIFSTGLYYCKSQIKYMEQLIQKGIMFIIDESAASPAHLLTRLLPPSNNILAFFSPHKYLSINSSKFAVIVCSQQATDYFEDWVDVFIGSIPRSACEAIEHYLSPNYCDCFNIHEKYVSQNILAIHELLNLFPDNFYLGIGSTYITIQNKTLPFINTFDSMEMYRLMKKTHISFIPGYMNGFSQQWGACYRVNLTLDTSKLKSHLGRLFNYFSQ